MFLSKAWLLRDVTTSPPSVSPLSKQCGILNILQPYGTPQISSTSGGRSVGIVRSRTRGRGGYGTPQPVTGIRLLFYVDEVHTC
jgi:hypothetical protein